MPESKIEAKNIPSRAFLDFAATPSAQPGSLNSAAWTHVPEDLRVHRPAFGYKARPVA